MQINDMDSIFFEDTDITLEGYCTCDLYFPTNKETNITKNKAHYAQVFYLTCEYGMFQLTVSEELNICDIERVDGFESPDIILDNKLSEYYKNVVYRYYTFNKISNRNIMAYQYPIDDEFEVYMYDLKDCVIAVDETNNYTDVGVYFKKKNSLPEVNYDDFEKYVLSLKMTVIPITQEEMFQFVVPEEKAAMELKAAEDYLR